MKQLLSCLLLTLSLGSVLADTKRDVEVDGYFIDLNNCGVSKKREVAEDLRAYFSQLNSNPAAKKLPANKTIGFISRTTKKWGEVWVANLSKANMFVKHPNSNRKPQIRVLPSGKVTKLNDVLPNREVRVRAEDAEVCAIVLNSHLNPLVSTEGINKASANTYQKWETLEDRAPGGGEAIDKAIEEALD